MLECRDAIDWLWLSFVVTGTIFFFLTYLHFARRIRFLQDALRAEREQLLASMAEIGDGDMRGRYARRVLAKDAEARS